jgi:hypothetical protein
MFFGKKKSGGKTVVILDVESASVASGLAYSAPGKLPKLFAEKRLALPLTASRDSVSLLRGVEKAAREALQHASLVAARMRMHEKTKEIAEIARIAVFLSAPWTAPNPRHGLPRFAHDKMLTDAVRKTAEEFFGDVPVVFYASSAVAANTAFKTFPQNEDFLLSHTTGEVTELLLVERGAPHARATMPLGTNTFLRTLKTHGNLSNAEVASHFARAHAPIIASDPFSETHSVLSRHFAEHYIDTASDLLGDSSVAVLYVVAPEPFGDWLAESLSRHPAITGIFTAGGAIHTILPHHFSPQIDAHASTPDLSLIISALSIDQPPFVV